MGSGRSLGMQLGMGLIFLLLVTLFLVPVPDSLWRQVVLRKLGNQLHVFLFLAMTLLLYRTGPWAGRLAIATGLAAIIGAVVEFLQALTGRHTRWQDFGLDLIGIGVAVCWITWQRKRNRPALVFGVVLLLVVPWQLRDLPGLIIAQHAAGERFPLLADFETRTEKVLWGENDDGKFGFVLGDELHRKVLRLWGVPPSRYPGAVLRGFPRDWSEFSHLEFDIRAVKIPVDSLMVYLRFDDYRGQKEGLWATAKFTVGLSWEHLSVDLNGLETNLQTRALQFHDMDSLLFFLYAPTDTTVIELDNLRLTSTRGHHRVASISSVGVECTTVITGKITGTTAGEISGSIAGTNDRTITVMDPADGGGREVELLRSGIGWDRHPLVTERPCILGGVEFPESERGPAGHSDGDAVCHAICDAILGAAALGDIGHHFPDDDPAWRGASSLDLLARATQLVREAGFAVINVDCTVIAEQPQIAPRTAAMASAMATALQISPSAVSVKATRGERLGPEGRSECVTVLAIALLESA